MEDTASYRAGKCFGLPLRASGASIRWRILQGLELPQLSLGAEMLQGHRSDGGYCKSLLFMLPAGALVELQGHRSDGGYCKRDRGDATSTAASASGASIRWRILQGYCCKCQSCQGAASGASIRWRILQVAGAIK